MGKEMTNALGQVNISDEVIGIIGGVAAMECYGLVGMANRNIQDGISELLRREQLNRGVEVHVEPEGVVLDLYIIVEYGTNITEVAHNVMEKVKYSVENQVGVTVSRVNVHVQGVRVTSAEAKRK
ncbi:MAG TPA: Asp23/Gls24 family envelope stress response protein [Firmicutes bacterium]|nr:Asp23/Gls24 family envelope stress response protein [Bacillota bacterium]